MLRKGHRSCLALSGESNILKKRKAKKRSRRLEPDESRAVYRAVDLHTHDLRHEAGSRLLEEGCELHQVRQMLGHANNSQTSTYLNATLTGLHRSMKALDRKRKAEARRAASRAACKRPAKKAACGPLADRNEATAKGGKLLVN